MCIHESTIVWLLYIMLLDSCLDITVSLLVNFGYLRSSETQLNNNNLEVNLVNRLYKQSYCYLQLPYNVNIVRN